MADERRNVFSDMVSFNMRNMRGVMDFWFRYLTAVTTFSGFSVFLGEETRTVTLKGKKGAAGESTYTVENREFRTVSVRVALPGEVKNASGEVCALKGPGPDGLAEADPAEFELGPWQTRTVKIRATIPDAKENVDYKGDIEVWTRTQSARLVVRRTS